MGAGAVNFTILDETGPHDTLLFECDICPHRKLTSYQIERHARDRHDATRFTVGAQEKSPATTRNRSTKKAGVS